ncbi:hypothetical protein A2115_01515 [Candidatus Woesebacteria bacterium GWA1_41_8]|uniref:Glycosyl transferase family 1 domain-containing protein n=1 Tax=Candidatus Woesebacteria bacterium GWA1_41_8 TaxID=1802471 RepID=A0A1F7WHA1_9BACT|nr:MAG: hypothetical protein A2115_01515 [Candidatus Woesebacteria bacterium GWA1_41_8]
MKKIAIFHQEFYFSGGAERLIFEEMGALEKKGYHVEAWAPLAAYDKCFPQKIKKFRIYGFLRYLSFIPRELVILLSCLLAPLLVLRFYDFDLFYGTNQAGPWFAFLAAKIWRKPYIVFMPYPIGLIYPRKIDRKSGYLQEVPFFIRGLMRIFKPIIKFLDWQIMTQANTLLTTGDYAKAVFEKIYKREVINAPSGADPLPQKLIKSQKRFMGEVEISGKRIKKPYVLITNRPMSKKRFDYMIKGLPKILKTLPDVRLVVAGDFNDYTRELKRLAEGLGVGEKVIFLGFMDGKNLEKVYLEAAVYVYTAPEEDYGKGIVEAMAAAIPVVAWNNAGPTGIVLDGKTGYLAKPFAIEDFAEKVLKLLKNKSLNKKMGEAGRKLVWEKFTQNHHQFIFERQIEGLLGNRD